MNEDELNNCFVILSQHKEDEIEWENNTMLNQAFTQLSYSDNNDGIFAADISNEIKGTESHEIGTLSILKPEKYDADNKVKTEEVSPCINIKKNNDILCPDIIPNKKVCFNNTDLELQDKFNRQTSSINDFSFYGLPNFIKELIYKFKGIEALYEWQNECLNLDAVKNRKNLVYALPTSGGKTLVAEILMLKEIICNEKNVVFILPFVAIVQEKVHSMTPFALELGFLIEEYAGTKGYYPPRKRHKKRSIYICTIEKGTSLINSLIEIKRFQEIGLIVIDELHLLGENGGRGATLEGLLTKIMYINEDVQIIGMSATIGNLCEISQFLNAELYTGNFRPIEIKEYVKCGNDICLVNVQKEELLTDTKKINYPYSSDAAMIDPDQIGGLVMDVVPKDSCLIFCSNRKNCENVALLLTRVLSRSLEDYKKAEKQQFLIALTTEEGLCPVLQKTVPFGIAYHHSGLTSEERKLLEDGFRLGVLCVICCTSTLAAGVNLPARRVILRNPFVGKQFLNLSKYKQMIGRAGRAGMGNVGESILICKSYEIEKVKTLLTSKMDDSLSTLHIEKDRGINNLILSAILLSVATTRNELHKLSAKSLLDIQQKRLNINVKEIMDETIRSLLKSGVLKIKELSSVTESDLSVVIASPAPSLSEEKITRIEKIAVTAKTELELSALGRAAMKGCMELQCARVLYQDLKVAQKHLILLDYLHLLYLVTPYDIVHQIKPIGSVYYDVVTKLTQNEMETARHLGINEVTVSKLQSGVIPRNVDMRVVHRFYVTLMLHELYNHHTIYSVAMKYQVNRGIVQNLFNTVSTFTSSVVRFCQELDEFWTFRDLFSTFSKKLSYCCPLELEALMELPLVKIGRARQLYSAGYTTLQSIAKENPQDLQKKIRYLSKKSASEIIASANLLILEKVENLKDEVEDVLDGLTIGSAEYTLSLNRTT